MATKDWLPYGSSHPSVKYADPLTSEAGFLANPSGTPSVVNAGGVWDSVLGYNPKGAGYLNVNAFTDYVDLDEEGQLSMEVERDWLCRFDAATWSNGDAAENSTVFLGTQPTAGASTANFVMKDSVGANDSGLFGSAAIVNVHTHTAGKSRFVRVNIGWSGGKVGGMVWWAFDGLINGVAIRGLANPNWINVFLNMFIGADRTGASNVQDHFGRHLQLANEAPMIPVHSKLSKVAILSDSLFNSTATTDGTATGDYRDATTIFTIRRELNKLGIDMGDIYTSINGGFTVSGVGATTALSTKIPDLVAQNPTVVLYRPGTNDAINASATIDAAWDALLKADCTAMLARASVKAVIVGTVPTVKYLSTYDTPAVVAKVAAINAYIRALVDFDPRIYVAECYDEIGGESPPAESFIGQANGAADDLHLAGVGHVAHGVAYFKALIKAIAAV